MDSYSFLLGIAIILLFTKVLGSLSKRVHMPQVVGSLLAGLLLGPSLLGIVTETEFLLKTAEVGVIMLMFTAGLDTDLKELKKNGPAAGIIAVVGVIVPLIGGFIVYQLFFPNSTDPLHMLKCVFMGVILTATSVSITVETLREMGKLSGKVGSSIMGAAVIDDVLGIIILTIVASFKDPTIQPIAIFGRILGYFIFISIVGFAVHAAFKRAPKKADGVRYKKRVAIYGFVFCLLMAYVSEAVFQIADITGAYFAGLFLCNIVGVQQYIARKITVSSYMFFSPVFFASIGVKTNLNGFTPTLLVFSIVLLIVAIITKVIGCGLGAKLCKYTNAEALNVGIGMVSRGEVALIVAQKGQEIGLVSADVFPAVILVVIATTLLTPIALAKSMKRITVETEKGKPKGV